MKKRSVTLSNLSSPEEVLQKLKFDTERKPIYELNSHTTIETHFSSYDALMIDIFYREAKFYNKSYFNKLKLIREWDWEREKRNFPLKSKKYFLNFNIIIFFDFF